MEFDAPGAPAHTRTLAISLTQAGSGRIEVSGAILDLRKRGLVPMAGDLQTAGLIHDMRVRAQIEVDPPRVRSMAAEQPRVAFEPSVGTAGECCRDPRARIEAIAGASLDGASRALSSAIGGPRGCSHVLTLAQLAMSTVQTALELERERHAGAPRPEGRRMFHRSLSIDGLLGRDGLHLALQLADVHFAPLFPKVDTAPLERLAGRLEIRAWAEIDLDAMCLRSLRAAERISDRDTLDGPWRDRSDRVADLAGSSALGGMARALFDRLGAEASDRPLLDTLLNLAPALIQCIPAVTERWKHRSGARPSMMGAGGMTDSCYMWRRDGALHRRSDVPGERAD